MGATRLSVSTGQCKDAKPPPHFPPFLLLASARPFNPLPACSARGRLVALQLRAHCSDPGGSAGPRAAESRSAAMGRGELAGRKQGRQPSSLRSWQQLQLRLNPDAATLTSEKRTCSVALKFAFQEPYPQRAAAQALPRAAAAQLRGQTALTLTLTPAEPKGRHS